MGMLGKPQYSCAPITNLSSLARMLRMSIDDMLDLAKKSNTRYYKVFLKKKDGSLRVAWNARPPLKSVQARIKCMVLAKVVFPDYLTGGIAGRDYKTNAEYHKASKIVVAEDISDFFPSVLAPSVYKIWRDFFHFSHEVSDCLTRLTTKDGFLPQGAKTSSYLANLVLWDVEAELVDYFHKLGIRYSRLVDDITLSSGRYLSPSEKRNAIAKVYAMLARKGFKPKRKKHDIFTSGGRMLVNNLVVNDFVGLPKEERANIRAQVSKIEESLKENLLSQNPRSVSYRIYRSVSGKVAKLSRFHPTEGKALRARLQKLASKKQESIV